MAEGLPPHILEHRFGGMEALFAVTPAARGE
jgi:hypothetical protein